MKNKHANIIRASGELMTKVGENFIMENPNKVIFVLMLR